MGLLALMEQHRELSSMSPGNLAFVALGNGWLERLNPLHRLETPEIPHFSFPATSFMLYPLLDRVPR